MYVKSYKCRSSYYSAWFRDDGKLLHVMLMKRLGKGLLMDWSFASEITFEKRRSEWEELPYEPCLVAMPVIDCYKELWLKWGAYNESELSSSRTRKRIVPLSCLMDFISDFLDSHEGYHVDIASTYIVHGGATHQMTLPTYIKGCYQEEVAETIKIYLSEVLSP